MTALLALLVNLPVQVAAVWMGGRWRNGQLHTNDIIEARANIKNTQYKDAYALVQKAFLSAIAFMLGKIYRVPAIALDSGRRSGDRIGGESFRWTRARVFPFFLCLS